jgi:hypothetical protein
MAGDGPLLVAHPPTEITVGSPAVAHHQQQMFLHHQQQQQQQQQLAGNVIDPRDGKVRKGLLLFLNCLLISSSGNDKAIKLCSSSSCPEVTSVQYGCADCVVLRSLPYILI